MPVKMSGINWPAYQPIPVNRTSPRSSTGSRASSGCGSMLRNDRTTTKAVRRHCTTTGPQSVLPFRLVQRMNSPYQIGRSAGTWPSNAVRR